MSSIHDNTASTGGDEYSHSPTPRSRSNMMLTLTRSSTAENNVIDKPTVESLILDQVAIIFGFLKHNEIMHARVCTTWRDAAKKTLVPPLYFRVKGVRSYNAVRAMSFALPNLQQLTICNLGMRHKYSDGENPDERLVERTANLTAHDLNIMSNFRKLRILHVNNNFAALNGRYPVLFNFPMLQILKISCCPYLRWDLEMLSGFPLLRELELIHLERKSTGNLSSLRVLKSTLEEVKIKDCCNIRGNFMELVDFPCLRVLDILYTPIRGDIRHIQESDFPAAEYMSFPDTVIGGRGYQFQRVSDVPSFMRAIHPLLKRFPKAFQAESPRWCLSKDSADWYESYLRPPFVIGIILAGRSRWGWRWCSYSGIFSVSCEMNWLDPEPSEDSDDYHEYVECLKEIEDETTEFYRGYYKPPTEEEYRRLCQRDRED